MAYKMAIIGYGGMGSWHHSNLVEKITDIVVVGAYDVREEAKKTIEENKIISYNSAEDIYNDKSIDLVLVSTPNDTHMEYAIALLNSGKNVICEKPVAMNKAELVKIYEAAEKNNKLFTVHQNRRLDSDYLTIRKIFDKKILNNPFVIESRVQGSRQYLHGWRGYKINGGGMVYDWGIHLFDQMLDMCEGKIVEVSANLHQIVSNEVDDEFIATFRFENGLSYIVNISMSCFILHPRWHVCCSDGTAVIENWDLKGKIVKLSDDVDKQEWSEVIVYTAAGPTRSMAPRPETTTKKIKLPKVVGDWTNYYKNIASVLDGKAEPMVTKEQAMRLMELVDTVFLAHENKQSIKCYI